jgi:hypothetical protein
VSLVVDQSPREETANIFRVANIDVGGGTYTMNRAVNDVIMGAMVGGIIAWFLGLIRSGLRLIRKGCS